METVLTIAGSDCSGGAGIQADLKTFTAHKVYGMSAITALTVQNTCGVQEVFEVPLDTVAAQIDAVFTDIPPDAVKIGMVQSAQIIQVIADKLSHYGAKNIVLDPVMVSTSGHALMEAKALEALKTRLMPKADIITPNLSEAQALSGLEIPNDDKQAMLAAAQKIREYYPGAILIKGGHRKNDSDDLLYVDDQALWLPGKHIDTPNTHGTGCTLSSAIASNLALGLSLKEAVTKAKDYITAALSSGLALGKGNGPVDHCCLL